MVGVLSKRHCKCHGVSTSCAVRTYWHQTVSMNTIGVQLKRAYDNAVQIRYIQSIRRDDSEHYRLYSIRSKRVDALDLVYSFSTPNLCLASEYSPGTRGRECCPHRDTCESLCCGRGYNSTVKTLTENCHCAPYLSDIRCEKCIRNEIIYICK